MSEFYLGSIDLTKIKKEDVVTTDKNGQPFKNDAKYLNISVWVNDEADKYGNKVSIKAGKKDSSYYIGNAKEWKQEIKPIAVVDDDGLPF
jgi:hypothetical protein